MDDKNVFEILLKFGLDKEKATEAVKELGKLKDATKDAGKQFEKTGDTAAAKFKDVKKSVELVGGQIGVVGHLLRYVFNPGILGAAALAKAIGSVWDAFWKFADGIKRSSINAAKSIGDIKTAMLELNIEQAKADVAFKTAMEDFERHAKRRIEIINLEKEAVLQLLDANEKLELAAAKSPEDEAAIKKRYESARGRANSAATEKELAAQETKLKEMEELGRARIREGYAASGGRTPEQVKLGLKNLPKALSSLDEQIAEQEKIVADLSSITTVAGAFPYWNDPVNYGAQHAAYTSSKETLQKLKDKRNRIAGSQLPLERADVAYTSGTELLKNVSTGREELANARSDASFRNQTSWRAEAIAGGQGVAGEMVAMAASGADALKGGGKATAQQAQAMNRAAALLGLMGQNSNIIINMLSRMNDNQTAFNNSLRVLQRKLDDQTRVQNNRATRP